MADIVTIGMDLDATKVVSAGKQAEQALTSVATASGKTEGALAGVQKAALALGVTFGAYKAIQMAKEVLTLGARYETLGVVMVRLGQNVNKSASEMDALQASLQKTGISMIEARANIASMIQAEMDLGKATQLARVAQDAAVIANMNSSEAFANLVYGIQSGQIRILRTMGIMVQFEAAYDKAAKTLNKNKEALTEQERAAARVNEVMLAGGRIAGAYEAAMATAGKQIQSTKRYLEDAKVKISEVFQPAYTRAVFAYAEVLKLIAFWAKEVSYAIAGLLTVLLGKGVAVATAMIVQYNLALKATAAAAVQAAQATVVTAAQEVTALTAVVAARQREVYVAGVQLAGLQNRVRANLILNASESALSVTRNAAAAATVRAGLAESVYARATQAAAAAQAQLAVATGASAAAQDVLAASTSRVTGALTLATSAAKGFWAAIGGPIGLAVIGAVAAYYALDRYLNKMVEANEMTEEETAAFEKANKAYWDRIEAEEAAAAAASESAAAAAKAQKELGLELEKQKALVEAFGSTEHAMALLNLKYEEKEALAKAGEGMSVKEAAALRGMTAAIFEQRRALLELEEQKRKMVELIKPLETTVGGVTGEAMTLYSLNKELEARKALLAATQEGTKAVRELAIHEAGIAAAAPYLALGMEGFAEAARLAAEATARVNFEIEDFSDKATGQLDVVGMALEAMGQQLGGLAGDIGQVVAQFFVMGRAAKLAADKAGEAFDAMDFVGAGMGGALPGIIGMSVNALLGELFGGGDDAGRQAEELRRAQEANTQALDRVAKSLDDYGRQLAGMSAAQVQDTRAVWQTAGFMTGQQPPDLMTGGPSVATIKEVAERYGMKIEDFWRLSAEEWEKLYNILGDVLEEARKYIQEQMVPDFAARAATLRGDDIGAARIRREAAAAKEIKDLNDLAAAGFITAAQLAEFTRIINDELVVALKEAMEAAAEAARVLVEDLTVRGFTVTGQTDAAARASLAFTQRRERIGMEDLPAETQALLLAVQDFERRVFELDLATNNQIKAIEEATAKQVKAIDEQIAAIEKEIAARDFARSVIARGLRVTGRGDEADALEMGWAQQAERSQFAGNPIMLGFLDVVQGLERDSLVRGQQVAAQTSTIQAGAAASQAAYDTQISVAQNQLSVAEEQLQAQQQTVEETRRVVEALDEFSNAVVLSDYSPLSPIQQLAEAKRQFAAMAAAAMSGDAGAAAGLPEAARALLDKSRGVNASNVGYATDFAGVQATIAAVRERFAGQLSQDEKVLAQMEGQSASLRAQIDALVANREQVAVSAQAQIEALNAAAKQADIDAKAVYDAAWAIAKKEAERLETFKQEEIDRLAKQRDEAIAAAEKEIELLQAFRDKQVATWATEFNAGLATANWQITVASTLGNMAVSMDRVANETAAVAGETRATVRVLQAGLATVVERLEAVETAVSGVGTTVKRGLAE